ncbi:MAG: hypothetical protein H7Y86_10405 [Rhizobacter sp.]|nr:hypothetical protein [Ferruginibacter sp.]
MNTGLIIATSALTGIFFLYQFFKGSFIKQKAVQFASGMSKYSLSNELPQDEVWWALLDTPAQLELAVALARKALPVWQKYSETNELLYKNSPTGTSLKINSSLLQTSLDEITQASSLRFPENNKYIVNCYNEFVAPLVALHDGNWTVTYPVKKIFLAVYNILKAIGEQENITVVKNLFSLSINQSLDCLDMCKLYSREEIKSFLNAYRVQPV